VNAKTRAVVVAILVLLLCGLGVVAVNGVGGGDNADETAIAPEETAPQERARERMDAPREPIADDAAGGQADPTESANAPDVESKNPPPPRLRSLTARVLRHLPPREVPPGHTEIRTLDDIPEITDDGASATGLGSGPRTLPYWSRWPRAPERGTVTIRGEVRDAAGVALAGATVYRIQPDESGSRPSPCSYQFAKKLGTTAAGGRFEATEQLAGAWLLAADHHGMMNRSRGLDISPAVAITAAESQTIDGIVIRLPIESQRIASVAGLLVDENGKPLKGEAWVGRLRREWVKSDGKFAFDALSPGDHTLAFGSTGYASETVEITLTPGERRELRVELDLAEQGDLFLEGRVVDRAGAGVADAKVFMGASRHGSRWATTDESGLFRFENLPRKYARTTVDVMVSPHPERDMYVGSRAPGITIPQPGLVLTVDRLAPLTLTVVDAETGEPVRPLVVETQWEYVQDGETRQRQVGGAWKYTEDGRVQLRAGQGRNVLTVRGEGHRAVEVEVIVEDLTLPLTVRIELQPDL